MFNNTYSNVTEELSRLHLSNATPQQYSPGIGKKIGPVVPPKPKKPPPQHGHASALHQEGQEQAVYGNIGMGAVHGLSSAPSSTHAGVEDYYAVNAPAPGTVGVASARIMSSGGGAGGGVGALGRGLDAPLPAGGDFSGVIVPGAVYTSSAAMAPAGGLGGGGGLGMGTYTPPPPQPAHSYTPTSRVAVPMSAQPLYSNTASQPIYNNSPRAHHAHAGGGGSGGVGSHSPPPPLPASQPPTSQHARAYANMSTNGAAYPPTHALYANLDAGTPTGLSQYATFGPDEDFPLPPPDEGPPPPSPPSPVSSSYSELRRATPTAGAHHNGGAHVVTSSAATPTAVQGGPVGVGGVGGGPGSNYGTYAPGSHTSSTYESIYEPITPRPSSQMSNKSGYSLYGPYTSPRARGLAPPPSNQPLVNPDKVGKEAEVDALTNLLVQSMDSTNDPEFFGAYESCICTRCGEKVVGEGSGCTAMEQVYHIKCFVCIVCHLQLQGKPFYALDSKPYCEDCYLNTLEKCCVCTKPILDRILRATGKPYHPQCFTCVVCNKSLDGIPFTVDASNQIHCIDDFHKKFAPRCTVCHEPIMPEPGKDETVRVVALDRSFHVNCYKCEDCGLVLSSEAEGRGCYPLDGHVLCKSCNARRVQAITSKVTTDL
ncbi:thyroid receptor-interacting protein 6-like isoform X1 [Penaeus indicus]|uniref:thyroid receptor-interacting protein 6-like isoform X1 n=1 Tax=Penaeus indicus TaxID=29960 RepID=UPI00300D2B8B